MQSYAVFSYPFPYHEISKNLYIRTFERYVGVRGTCSSNIRMPARAMSEKRRRTPSAGARFSRSHGSNDRPGCRVGERTYAEGEMVRDIEWKAACDNCFCAMGAIRCVPLACAPPLQGCSPIVREGQCCPSTYNCSEFTQKFLLHRICREHTLHPAHTHGSHGRIVFSAKLIAKY